VYILRCRGNTLPLLVIACGILLLLLKAVDYRSSVGFTVSYGILFFLYRLLFPETAPVISDLFIGNFLLTAFFILPDHRAQARTLSGRWVGGVIAGMSAFIIRIFSGYADGVLFAVILAAIFNGLVDELLLNRKHRKVRT
jgi:Na+-translocating ferredoxin:NAD+ oxidoreductase subunit D